MAESWEADAVFAAITGRTEMALEHDFALLKKSSAHIEFRGAPKTGGYYVVES